MKPTRLVNSKRYSGHAFKPYPAYKDSEIEWLGKVPAHWEVRRLGTIAEMRVSNVDKHSRDGELPVRLCNYVDVYKADRIQTEMALMAATATAEEIEKFRLLPGDVLITKDSEAWDDIGVPTLVEGVTRQHGLWLPLGTASAILRHRCRRFPVPSCTECGGCVPVSRKG